jgi:hypothetical protein
MDIPKLMCSRHILRTKEEEIILGTYFVEEYKGLKVGQEFKINSKEYKVYRIDDKKNQVTLIAKSNGFYYADIDELIKFVNGHTV